MNNKKTDYKSAGVDIEAGNEAVNLIKEKVKSTHTKEVLTGIGSFGSLYSIKEILSDYVNPVLVQSIDGVGTKTIIARKMKKFNTIGIDLLSACANDILVMGAKPLTFLDYIANDKLKPIIVDKIVGGMAKACKETGVSLVGGETAEMPDTYLPGEHDLVGLRLQGLLAALRRPQALGDGFGPHCGAMLQAFVGPDVDELVQVARIGVHRHDQLGHFGPFADGFFPALVKFRDHARDDLVFAPFEDRALIALGEGRRKR